MICWFLAFSKVVNHPVHFVNKNMEKSPSAFIPFCEFGQEKMASTGVKIDQFHIPVCNSFEAIILGDQRCYQIDLNRFSTKDESELTSGFAFIMDYNEDRQVTFEQEPFVSEDDALVGRIDESDDDKHAYIYLNTIGKMLSSISKLF